MFAVCSAEASDLVLVTTETSEALAVDRLAVSSPQESPPLEGLVPMIPQPIGSERSESEARASSYRVTLDVTTVGRVIRCEGAK